MTPDERQLLEGLFDRIRASSGAPRDGEAESLIAEAVRSQPYAPYLLAQTVLVQEHALRAAASKLQEMESRLSALESAREQPAQPTSFLGNLGKSLFGGAAAAQPSPARPLTAPSGAWGQTAPPPAAPQPNAPQFSAPPPGPWGAPPQAPAAGGFLHGALGTAAGVAGGVLLAHSISSLFAGSSGPFGMGGGMGAAGFGGGETIVNNYYGDSSDANPQDANPSDPSSADFQQGDDQSGLPGQDDGSGVQDAGFDDSGDWSGGDDSGGFDV